MKDFNNFISILDYIETWYINSFSKFQIFFTMIFIYDKEISKIHKK